MKKNIIVFCLPILIFSLTSSALAQATDNFADVDNYQQGNLNGQDGWSRGWNTLLVQGDIIFDGSSAIKNQKNVGGIGYKDLPGNLFDAGVVSMQIRIDANNFSDNQDIFGIFKGIGEESLALVRFANNFNGYSNTLLISVAGSTDTEEIGRITQGEWHRISLAWRESDFNIRVKIDDHEWSEWFSSQTSWSKGEPLGIRINLPAADDHGDFYIDGLETFVGTEIVLTVTEEEKEVPLNDSITSLVDTTSTSIVTVTIDGELPSTATSTVEEVISAPLDETSIPITLTTTF